MASLKVADLVLLIVLLLFLMSVRADMIDDTCNRTSDTELCLSTLRSDPRSSTADAKGLAHIVLDITLKKAKDNVAQIDQLLSRTTDPALKDVLTICSQEYGNATVVILPRAIQKLESKFDAEATGNVEDSAGCAKTCEESFSDGPRPEQNRPSPFTDQNNAVLHLARLAEDIIVSFAPDGFFSKGCLEAVIRSRHDPSKVLAIFFILHGYICKLQCLLV
ncbi:Pectinesterase inhibitor domain - like 2 [Theobroma cacao]|uniref:Pectinesterase inhibitor domain-containing protein n=1 Tax=Theobroma cacao TaxID=3641 RepID=A0A061DR99_THECC|nr:Uncharacterized protein TCM_004852 [Theobroma cacao]WRX07947.1 Pectinesterase inhibitor domain - like 2 [Theobroma cacao]